MEKIALVEEPGYWCSPESLERPELGPYSETSGDPQTLPKGRRTSGGDQERKQNEEKTEDRTPLTNVEMSAICLQLTYCDGMLTYGLESRRD